MGLDLLDLSFRIEQRFSLKLPPQAFTEMAGWSPDNSEGRPFDVTVGQIYEYLLARLAPSLEAVATLPQAYRAPMNPHSLWAELRHLPLSLGFVGAWSMPIKSAADGRVLGTFGTYYRELRQPSTSEIAAVRALAASAALAIDQAAAP